jgi:hypothetical protein
MNRSNQGRTQKQTNIAITGLIAAAIVAIVAFGYALIVSQQPASASAATSAGEVSAPPVTADGIERERACISSVTNDDGTSWGNSVRSLSVSGNTLYVHSTLYDKPSNKDSATLLRNVASVCIDEENLAPTWVTVRASNDHDLAYGKVTRWGKPTDGA